MNEFFKDVGPIRYEGPDSRNPLAFKWYNARAKVAGKPMEEHLRFSMAYWHTLKSTGSDPFGSGTFRRPWNASSDPMQAAEATLRAAFEFCTKLGLRYYCFHDRDIAPEGATLAETNRRLDAIVKLAKKLQRDTGVRLLWNTANLFSHPRYMHGAATNPDVHVFACAAAQVKKMLEVGQELGAANYVFWGGREGYETLLNTDMARELDHLAAFLRMAVDYARKIGFKAQFLIEPKPKEPTKHQYDFDAATVIGFLRQHRLDGYFKLNVEANHATLAGHTFEHDMALASANGMLGSLDANRGDPLLGWDTDQFPVDLYTATYAMSVVLAQGGIGRGGLNFDAKVRRGSFEGKDLFHAHIGAMDAFARGLLIAARMQKDGVLAKFVARRYASWDQGLGRRIEQGKASLAECERFAIERGEPRLASGRQEMLENLVNQYILRA
jgi:xylose isomerase